MRELCWSRVRLPLPLRVAARPSESGPRSGRLLVGALRACCNDFGRRERVRKQRRGGAGSLCTLTLALALAAARLVHYEYSA